MKTLIKDGGPAFPADELHDQTPPYRHLLASHGMSLRDYFAAKAMQSLILADTKADPDVWETNEDGEPVIAATAYAMADAMLDAREKQS